MSILALADGTVFHGHSFGAQGETVGEIVFNTAMTGYQEIVTDPSYAHQIVTLSYPHIGNTGCNLEDSECEKLWTAGLVVRDVPSLWSSWRGKQSLQSFLIEKNLVGICNIDTRQLIHHLRDKGAQAACISTTASPEEAIAKARAFTGLDGMDLATLVSTSKSYTWNKGSDVWSLEEKSQQKDYSPTIIAYDFGVKQHILEIFVDLGCQVTVVPAKTSAREVLQQNPDGIFLSNGPGDPKVCDYAIAATQTFLQKDIPLLGICLGFQIMALAAGATTYKMKFGHHGANHPVSCVEEDNKVMITSQNHGFAVDEKTLPESFQVTHRSLFDKSLQGIRHKEKPFFAFQGHPEASPGPHDAYEFFKHFMMAMKNNKNNK